MQNTSVARSFVNNSIKNLFTVAFLTALGHLLSVLLYPIAARYLSEEDLVSIGLIDSTMILLIAFIGFGLNATATRDIALSTDWKKVLSKVQSARITLALFCSLCGGIWLFLDLGQIEIGLSLLVAPIFAISYDFVLYGLAKPQSAAFVSFIRQSLPLSIFLLLVVLGCASPLIYFAFLVFFVFLAGILVSKFAGSALFYRPNKFFYRSYITASWVGIAGLFIVFQRFGFLTIIGERLTNSDFVYLATSLKVLLLVVACKRMLIQVFYTKLVDDVLCKKLNIFCFAMAVLSLLIAWFFSAELSQILFNSDAGQQYVVLIGFGACALLFFAVSDSKLLLKRQDKWMFLSNFICGLLFICCVFLIGDYFNKGTDFLYLFVVIELLLSILYKIGLVLPKSCFEKYICFNGIKSRNKIPK